MQVLIDKNDSVYMKTIITFLFVFLIDLLAPVLVYAFPIPIARFEDEGSLYVESYSIINKGGYVKLTYVENFTQPRSYGEHVYLSKATDVRIDCSNRRVFALKEYYYSNQDRFGKLMGAYALSDQFGIYAEHGSWVSQVVNIGCD